MKIDFRFIRPAPTTPILSILRGRAPTIKTSLPPSSTLLLTSAVFPADYSVDTPRECVDLGRTAIINELRNRGFVVIEAPLRPPLSQSGTELSTSPLLNGHQGTTLESTSHFQPTGFKNSRSSFHCRMMREERPVSQYPETRYLIGSMT